MNETVFLLLLKSESKAFCLFVYLLLLLFAEKIDCQCNNVFTREWNGKFVHTIQTTENCLFVASDEKKREKKNKIKMFHQV